MNAIERTIIKRPFTCAMCANAVLVAVPIGVIYSLKAKEQAEKEFNRQEERLNSILENTIENEKETKEIFAYLHQRFNKLETELQEVKKQKQAAFSKDWIKPIEDKLDQYNTQLDLLSDLLETYDNKNEQATEELKEEIKKIQPITLQMGEAEADKVSEYLKQLTDDMARITEAQIKPLQDRITAIETKAN